MNQAEAPSTKSSRPRSRPRGRQPTVPQLASFGIKVRDFAYESTLPPIRIIRRQPRQIQPGVARQLIREDTEPLDEQSQPQSSGPTLARTDTEPVLEKEAGPSLKREMGGFFGIDGSLIVNSRPFRVHPQTARYSHDIHSLVASQDKGAIIPTPTVTPNGSLQWKEPPTLSEPSTPTKILVCDNSHLHPSLSGFSPLIPLTSPPNRQGSSVVLDRTPPMASLPRPSPKRRKISVDNDSRPGIKRYYLRSPSQHPIPVPPSPRTVIESSSSSSQPHRRRAGTSKSRSGPRPTSQG